MAHKFIITNKNGTQETFLPSFASEQLIQKQIKDYEKAGYKVTLVRGDEWKPICPDCGREMERDGGTPYCEHCEG